MKYLILPVLMFGFICRAHSTQISIVAKGQPLSEILNTIEQKVDYTFVYNNAKIDVTKKYSLTVKKVDLETALQTLFKNSPIRYTILDKHIVLNNEKKVPLVAAQEHVQFSGTVYDSETGERLIGCALVAENNTYSLSNNYGFYSLSLEKGMHTITVHFMGFETQEIKLDLQENTQQNIYLNSSVTELAEVEVSSVLDENDQVNTLESVLNIRTVTLKKMPALLGVADLTRGMLTQAGVSSMGEGTSGFNVRGGNLDQNLILLDEAEFFNSSHLWGLFSNINISAIKDLKLYKGGIPARYGGRASSVLDIRLRDGNKKKIEGAGSISPIISQADFEGPIIKDRSSFLISGRMSNLNLFLPLFKSDDPDDFIDDLSIGFYDLSAKLDYKINDKNTLYASGYFGADFLKTDFKIDETDLNAKIDFGWRQQTGSLRWTHLFSERLFANTTLLYSTYDYRLKQNKAAGEGPTNVGGDVDWSAFIENFTGKIDFSYFYNASNTFRFGATMAKYQFQPTDFKETAQAQQQNRTATENENALSGAVYGEWIKKWDAWEFNVGLRTSYFAKIGPGKENSYRPGVPRSRNTLSQTTTYKKGAIIKDFLNWEPRLSIRYKINPQTALKFNYNRLNQYIHLISNTNAVLPFDVWRPSGPYIRPLDVHQWALGGAFNHENDGQTIHFSLEGYYKTLHNFVEYKDGANLFLNPTIETELLHAQGYAYGLESSLFYQNNKITGQFNYTYSQSKRKTLSPYTWENINRGNYYPSNFERPHILNLNMDYALTSQISLNGFFTYQSGRPISIPTGVFNLDSESLFHFPARNNYRLDANHRLDLAVTFYPKKKPNRFWKSHWVVGCYNLYGRKNPFTVATVLKEQAPPSRNTIPTTFQVSLLGSAIPYISYNFKF